MLLFKLLKNKMEMLKEKINKKIKYFKKNNKYVENYLFIYFTHYEEILYIPNHLIYLSKYISTIYSLSRQNVSQNKNIQSFYQLDKDVSLIIIDIEPSLLGLKNLSFLEIFVFCDEYILYPYIQIYSDFLKKLSNKTIGKIKNMLDFLMIDTENIFYLYVDNLIKNNFSLENHEQIKN